MKDLALYAVVVLGYMTFGVVTGAGRDTGDTMTAGNLDAFQLQVGDCFDQSAAIGDEVRKLPGVPCKDPHDYETFAVFDVSLASYPSEEKMSNLAYEECLQRFNEFVGIDFDASVLEIVTLYPTTQSWQQNDREIVCALNDMNGNKLIGTTRGRAF